MFAHQLFLAQIARRADAYQYLTMAIQRGATRSEILGLVTSLDRWVETGQNSGRYVWRQTTVIVI